MNLAKEFPEQQTKFSYFLGLPPEIRHKILEYVLVTHGQAVDTTHCLECHSDFR